MIAASIIAAAVGVAVGYLGGAHLARHLDERSRETKAMRERAALVRVLTRTARPNKGNA